MYSEREIKLINRAETALIAAQAARVPDDDRAGPGSEPVTISGYYEVPTKSGRAAWVYYYWGTNGQVRAGVCTYDPDLERALSAAYANDPRQFGP